MTPTGRTAARERLSRDVVAARALALADAEGLDALTVRRLAQDLGVTPMALYWHFSDKDALLAGVADQLLREVRAPEPSDAPWADRLHAELSALLAALRAHPGLARLAQLQVLSGDAGLALAERVLALLRGAGFSVAQASQIASHGLATIVELVATEPGAELDVEPGDREARTRAKRARLMTLPPADYPNLVESVDEITSCRDEAGYYELGLELFIAGVRSVRAGSTAR